MSDYENFIKIVEQILKEQFGELSFFDCEEEIEDFYISDTEDSAWELESFLRVLYERIQNNE